VGGNAMSEGNKSFYHYRDLVICLEEIIGLMVRHSQANWFVEIIFLNGTIMNYECIHKDEAVNLFGAIRKMLNASEIVISQGKF
jgi:hypothetical protein